MEYRFSYGAVRYVYGLILKNSTTMDEILLRTLSRLVYFRERTYNFCTKEEFNELNIYFSIFCHENEDELKLILTERGWRGMFLGALFYKKWKLEIVGSAVWAETKEGETTTTIKLYDFGIDVTRQYLLKAMDRKYKTSTIEVIKEILLKEDFSEKRHLLLILSTFTAGSEWTFPKEILLHYSSRKGLSCLAGEENILCLDGDAEDFFCLMGGRPLYDYFSDELASAGYIIRQERERS